MLILDHSLILLLPHVINKILPLSILLDVIQMGLPVGVVMSASVSDLLSEAGCLVGNGNLLVKPVLLVQQFLQPVFHQELLLLPLLQRNLFLEFGGGLQARGLV